MEAIVSCTSIENGCGCVLLAAKRLSVCEGSDVLCKLAALRAQLKYSENKVASLRPDGSISSCHPCTGSHNLRCARTDFTTHHHLGRLVVATPAAASLSEDGHTHHYLDLFIRGEKPEFGIKREKKR